MFVVYNRIVLHSWNLVLCLVYASPLDGVEKVQGASQTQQELIPTPRTALHIEHQALAAHTRTKREAMSKDPTQLGADLISPPGNAAALATGLKNATFLKKHGTFWILCCGPCGPAF